MNNNIRVTKLKLLDKNYFWADYICFSKINILCGFNNTGKSGILGYLHNDILSNSWLFNDNRSFHCLDELYEVINIGHKDTGTLLLDCIENGLHTSVQTQVCFDICKSNTFSQVFIETYSDHIIHSFRVAVKEKLINHNDITIHYFMPLSESDNRTRIWGLKLDRNGTIDYYPDRFLEDNNDLLVRLLR